MILVLFAHPYPSTSRACAALLSELAPLPGVTVHSLYERYPDFDIDVASEQQLLAGAEVLVLLHPLYWYSVPALLKHWFDRVLVKGWAYGEGAALAGKECLWVTTTGGDEPAFSEQGRHAHPFATFTAPIEQTVRFCGMRWREPFVVHGAHLVSDDALRNAARELRARLLPSSGNQGAS